MLVIIERELLRVGWNVWALVFDGVVVAPSAACAELDDVAIALEAVEAACRARGWGMIKLAEKPLHGKQGETPKSIFNARTALETWQIRQTYEENMDWERGSDRPSPVTCLGAGEMDCDE